MSMVEIDVTVEKTFLIRNCVMYSPYKKKWSLHYSVFLMTDFSSRFKDNFSPEEKVGRDYSLS